MNYINKINKFLIENYPSIWNTRLVWVACVSLCIHIFSFVIGFFYYSNPKSLESGYIINEYFTSGLILVHVIISVIILVVWFSKLIQNNAFKNYYPFSKSQLFFQFFQYFIILFISSTFYFSHMLGVKTYINVTYKTKEFNEWKTTSNLAMAFLPQSAENYSLLNRLYPDDFKNLYAETNSEKINFSKPYLKQFGTYYQFYTLRYDSIKHFLHDNVSIYNEVENDPNFAYIDNFENHLKVYYKEEVKDLSNYVTTSNLSLFNYSKVFYEYQDDYTGYKYMYDNYNAELEENTEKNYILNKNIASLLKAGNEDKVDSIMKDFFLISQELNIDTNLNFDKWKAFKNSYLQNNEIAKFIGLYKEHIDVDTTEAYSERSELTRFYEKNKSNYYYKSSSLGTIFSSIDSIKNFQFLGNGLLFYLSFSLGLGLLIFSYRIANIRSLVLAGITFGVLSLIVGLFSIFILYVNNNSYASILGFVCVVGFLIMSLPFILKIDGKKKILGVSIVFSICTFPVLLMYSLLFLREIENLIFELEIKNNTYQPYFTISDGGVFYYAIIFLTMVFVYFYSTIILRWKAAAE